MTSRLHTLFYTDEINRELQYYPQYYRLIFIILNARLVGTDSELFDTMLKSLPLPKSSEVLLRIEGYTFIFQHASTDQAPFSYGQKPVNARLVRIELGMFWYHIMLLSVPKNSKVEGIILIFCVDIFLLSNLFFNCVLGGRELTSRFSDTILHQYLKLWWELKVILLYSNNCIAKYQVSTS